MPKSIPTLKKVRHVAVQACSTAAGAGKGVMAQSMRLVARNPVRAICGAVALGALATWALRRRRSKSL